MKKLRREALFLLLTPLIMLSLLECFARGSIRGFITFIFDHPLMCLLNYAWLAGFCLLGGCLRSQRLRAALSVGACWLCALFGIANHYKLIYRLEPLLISDVNQLGDAAATVTGLHFNINVGQLVWVCLLFVVALIAVCFLCKARLPKFRPLPVLAGLLVLTGVPFLCTFELADGSIRTDMADHARNEGCLYTAFAAENHRRSLMLKDYSQQEVEDACAALQTEVVPAPVTESSPNVIFVLSESFTDEAILGQYVDFTRPLMPFYQSLVQQCRTGLLYVPKIGGGTSETEFEVLTGMQSKYAVNPYSMGLPPISSVAGVLRQKGYTASAIHWYSGVYYNRYTNLRMEGFDAFYTTDTTSRSFQKTGMFVSDSEHYRSIMEQLQKTPGRDFIFCLTMQNHGGYEYDDFRQTYGADQPFTNTLSSESEKLLSNYCYLLGQSDAALKDWIAQLQAFPEPTLVVFFGDHLPPLGTETYQELGIPLSGDSAHQTPYFIWSNQANTVEQTDLYAYQLGSYALSLAGLNDDPFLCHVEALRAQHLPQDRVYDLLSYDALFAKQYAYQALGLAPENTDFQVGGKMELQGFDAALLGDAVYLRARLTEPDQSYHLCLNGKLRDTLYVPVTDKPFTLQCKLTNYSGKVYNESRILAYANTAELLAASGSLPYQTYSLTQTRYELVQDKWYQGYVVFKSIEPFPAAKNNAVTIDGQALQWQPTYGISKAGQFSVDGNGHCYLAIDKKALRDRSPQGLQDYLRRHQAALVVFEE